MDEKPDKKAYRELALVYDELIGNTAFECWKENFERLADLHNIEFNTAADIACGTGLAASYLGARSKKVFAVDNSPWMLEVARDRDDVGNVVFLEQSFTNLDLPEKVDLLTCNFDSLNYLLVEEEFAEALRRFGDSLRPGGYAVFDMNTAREISSWGDTPVLLRQLDSSIFIWEFSWEPQTRTSTVSMTNFIKVDGDLYRMSEEVHQERCYDLELVLSFLTEAGFDEVVAHDARGLATVSEETRRAQFMARKRFD